MNLPIDKQLFTIYYENKLVKLSRPIDAFAWYSDYKINLLNGEKIKSNASLLHDYLNKIRFIDSHEKTVIHLTYEFGFYYVFDDYQFSESKLLAITIIYENKQEYIPKQKSKCEFKYKYGPKIEMYGEAFNKGQEKLLKGDCYQFNLTFPFFYKIENSNYEELLDTFFSNKELLSAYAHVTWLPTLGKMLLSNSPECLFQLKKKKRGFLCWTMPIKGSLKLIKKSDFNIAWTSLKNSLKNQAELFMIADLLRNDLSKIERPIAKIINKKFPLWVPGILHQCSLIEVALSAHVSLATILKNIFPGGSVTGAPKRRVMEILGELEKYNREFYTGSTIILDQKIMAGSINIRTAEIDFNKKELIYKSGGGITLLSEKQEEFQEMLLKVDSFMKLFT